MDGKRCVWLKTLTVACAAWALTACKPQVQGPAQVESATGWCPDTKKGCLDRGMAAGLQAKKRVRSFIWTLPLMTYSRDGNAVMPLVANARGKPQNYFCFYRRDVPDTNDIFPFWAGNQGATLTAEETQYLAKLDKDYAERMYSLLCSARTVRLSKYGARADVLETELKKTALKNEAKAQWMQHVLSDAVNLGIIFAGAFAPVIAGRTRLGVNIGRPWAETQRILQPEIQNAFFSQGAWATAHGAGNFSVGQFVRNYKAFGTAHMFAFPGVLASQSISNDILMNAARKKSLETSYVDTAAKTFASLASKAWSPEWDMDGLNFDEINNITKEIVKLGDDFEKQMGQSRFDNQTLFHDYKVPCGQPYNAQAFSALMSSGTQLSYDGAGVGGIQNPQLGANAYEQVHPYCQVLAARFGTPPDNEHPVALVEARNMGENTFELQVAPQSHPSGSFGRGQYEAERIVQMCVTEPTGAPHKKLKSAPCIVKRLKGAWQGGGADGRPVAQTTQVVEQKNMFSKGSDVGVSYGGTNYFSFKFSSPGVFKADIRIWLPGNKVAGLPSTQEELPQYVNTKSELRIKRVCSVGGKRFTQTTQGHNRDSTQCWRAE